MLYILPTRPGFYRHRKVLHDEGENDPKLGKYVEKFIPACMIDQFMMRHVHDEFVDGKPIVELPPKTEQTHLVELNSAEMAVYTELHTKAKASFSHIHPSLRKQNTLKILSLLLPLRQMCSGSVKKNKGEDELDAECPICKDCLSDPVMSSCKHRYCRDCIGSMLSLTGNEPCPVCSKDVTLAKLKDVPQSSAAPSAPKDVQDALDAKIFTSKSAVLMASLKRLKAEDSTSKVLIFSQFQETLDRLKAELLGNGYEFRTLQGNMSRAQRTDALTRFQNDPPTTIFLLSTRASKSHIMISLPLFKMAPTILI